MDSKNKIFKVYQANTTVRTLCRSWLIKLAICLCVLLLAQVGPANAQEPEPPFWFDLSPSHENGLITYQVGFYSRVDWPMPDLTIQIPAPAGTRFVRADSLPSVSAGFDGHNVVFFTSAFNRYLEQTSFVLEVVDPTVATYTTEAVISWKGARAGVYQTEPVTLDITRPTLDWPGYNPSRLQLGLGAVVVDDTLTYNLYAKAIEKRRMWDVALTVPVPEDMSLLSVETQPPFAGGSNSHSVVFSTLELERQVEVGPLAIELSTANVSDDEVSTSVWAYWKNGPEVRESTEPPIGSGDEDVVELIPGEEQYKVDMVVAEPRIPQNVVFDVTNDVPLGSYDLTSIALQESSFSLTAVFNTADTIGPAGQPLEYLLFIDSDCNSQTGQVVEFRGAEIRIAYNHARGSGSFTTWNQELADWDWDNMLRLGSSVQNRSVRVTIPRYLIQTGVFCWVGQARNRTDAFNTSLPRDRLPDGEFARLTRLQMTTPASTIGGQLAAPLIDEAGSPTVYVLSVPGGEILDRVTDWRESEAEPVEQSPALEPENDPNTEETYQFDLADGRTLSYKVKTYEAPESAGESEPEDAFEEDNTWDAWLDIVSCDYHVENIEGLQAKGDAPSDTFGNLVAFTSARDGNLEAYVMNADGSGVRNISNSPGSNDGLPTFSPTGAWIAFVSDRYNQPAVWLAPVTGGEAEKLFDLPGAVPWGDQQTVQTDQCMSWEP